MKISELILDLEKVLEEYGDKKVIFRHWDGFGETPMISMYDGDFPEFFGGCLCIEGEY